MNIKEKGVILAKLMNWTVNNEMQTNYDLVKQTGHESFAPLCPYSDCKEGRSQFAAILLEFSETLCEFVVADGDYIVLETRFQDKDFTQANFLDEVVIQNKKGELKMLDKQECPCCGNEVEYDELITCPFCDGEKCINCDAGDNVPCMNCENQ